MTPIIPIPDGWTWAPLGEIADVVGGVTKDTKKQSDPALPLVPYLRVANVQRGHIDLTSVAEIRVPEATAKRLRLQPGDVLLNEGGDRDKLGRGWVWEGQIPYCIHQNHVFRARIRNGILHPKLLAWFANECAKEWFEKHGRQTTNLASISLSTIRQLPVPIPPAGKQKEIVDLVEVNLSHLASVQASLTAASLRLSAWEKLAIHQAIWEQGFPLRSVGELLAQPMRNGHSARATRVGEDGIRTLTLTAVTRNSFIDKFSKQTVAEAGRVVDLWLQPGDILVQRSNTPELVGTTAMYDGPKDWAIFPDLLIRLRANDSLVTSKYLAAALASERAHQQLRAKAKGLAGSMPKIDQNAIASTMVPVPDVETQYKVTDKLYEDAARFSRFRRAVATSLARVSTLQRRVIAVAYTGRLTGRPIDGETIEELTGV
jgi:type I restriction enzyme S subunit